jgi:hypothetical protein
MNLDILCVHKWSVSLSSWNAPEMKYCKRCDTWWVSDTDNGFINEPEIIIGRVREPEKR